MLGLRSQAHQDLSNPNADNVQQRITRRRWRNSGPGVRFFLTVDSRLTKTTSRLSADVLRSDWLTTGPKVAEFEEAFAARVGAKYAVSSVPVRQRCMALLLRQGSSQGMKRLPPP